ncbi:MAG: translesion DNA synthesis-associated protein ImuA [Spongiibacteraceae bacterium]
MTSPPNPSLQTLLQRPDLWRLQDGGRAGRGEPSGLETGFAALDTALHGGGWPRAALTELLVGQAGIGELQLLLPALAELSRQQLWQVWINPPFIPYAPVLAQNGIALESVLIVRTEARQQLWACEQALRSAACGAVLFWPAQVLRYAELRKLQVAASGQQCLAFVVRGLHNATHTSPAVLRLQLGVADGHQLSVEILKQRGGRSGQRVLLPRPLQLHAQIPLHERIAFVSDDSLAPSPPSRSNPKRIERIAPKRPRPATASLRRGGYGMR